MNLALFDADRTLVPSTGTDDRCFAQAVSEVPGISGFSTNWPDRLPPTDSGQFRFAAEEPSQAEHPHAVIARQTRVTLDRIRQRTQRDQEPGQAVPDLL